ncbi:MAG: class I SAM-dependent methyltransferase [Thioploca sp.]|nr:class I SAM-dependent methyltransferase [Thioploca sp.]
MKSTVKKLLEKLPYCGKSIRANKRMMYPPGHFYSPIALLEDIKLKEKEIFDFFPRKIAGIDLNETEQLTLLNEFKKYYQELPFSTNKKAGLRYFFEGEVLGYGYSDAITLYCMIRHLQPKKIIEVGCGKSSCVTLDTNELFFDNSISCTFIEPYPKKFFSLIKPADLEKVEVIPKKLQEVELSKFSTLSAGDILFIDSTHVSKINSDVNYIFFNILPHLQAGVFIHFHDVFYPFEYPKEWIYSGIAWNEDYLLRAFLQYNNAFKIVFFNSFLIKFYEQKIKAAMPLLLTKAGSIWIKKI